MIVTGLKSLFITTFFCILFCNVNAQEQNKNDEAALRSRLTTLIQQQTEVRTPTQVALSPDGRYIAWTINGVKTGSQVIYVALVANPSKAWRITAGQKTAYYYESNPKWSPDGKRLAFLSDAEKAGQAQPYIIAVLDSSAKAVAAAHFHGYISQLKWSPNGKNLSLLYVEAASRAPSPFAAKNNNTGIIDSLVNTDIQRLAVIDLDKEIFEQVSPKSLYVFEYDWSPDSKQFIYTAAAPPGDDNWYIAQLYLHPVQTSQPVILYAPFEQIALPRWSPDGKRIAFIQGLMSDEGGTGGEIYLADVATGKVENLTPDRTSTPSWLSWRADSSIVFTEFVGGSSALALLNTSSKIVNRLWVSETSTRAVDEVMSISVTSNKKKPAIAMIRSSWSSFPEIWTGSLTAQNQWSHFNDDASLKLVRSKSISWHNEEYDVQGWLLYPANYDSTKKYPLLVNVHGGPAWIAQPGWISHDFNGTLYTELGYFVFFPNPRGSYGQGEKFTKANRRDWGYGDLRDVLSGVDAVVKNASVDSSKVGLLGWSYGGSTAMFAVTQTNRFKAVVAGAGAADWLSYYGQNSIDKWMRPYFLASPYDDPAAYAKCSAMTFIKQAKTPALVLAGEFDGEAPPTQAFQFWHALKELGTPTQLIVYPDEGHGFYKAEDRLDVTLRSIQWFGHYLNQ